MFNINKFIHIDIIAQGKDVDEDLAVLYSVIMDSFQWLQSSFWIQRRLFFFYRNLVTFSIVDNILENIFAIL